MKLGHPSAGEAKSNSENFVEKVAHSRNTALLESLARRGILPYDQARNTGYAVQTARHTAFQKHICVNQAIPARDVFNGQLRPDTNNKVADIMCYEDKFGIMSIALERSVGFLANSKNGKRHDFNLIDREIRARLLHNIVFLLKPPHVPDTQNRSQNLCDIHKVLVNHEIKTYQENDQILIKKEGHKCIHSSEKINKSLEYFNFEIRTEKNLDPSNILKILVPEPLAQLAQAHFVGDEWYGKLVVVEMTEISMFQLPSYTSMITDTAIAQPMKVKVPDYKSHILEILNNDQTVVAYCARLNTSFDFRPVKANRVSPKQIEKFKLAPHPSLKDVYLSPSSNYFKPEIFINKLPNPSNPTHRWFAADSRVMWCGHDRFRQFDEIKEIDSKILRTPYNGSSTRDNTILNSGVVRSMIHQGYLYVFLDAKAVHEIKESFNKVNLKNIVRYINKKNQRCQIKTISIFSAKKNW